MFETVLPFILKYKYIFLFYLALILLLIIKRKKITVQAKIIVLYRMKFGLKFIEKISQKFRQFIILLGYVGVGAGYVGLIAISYVLIKNLIDLIIKPAVVSGVSLVLPGIDVPGLGILPFWYWLIAIFIIAIVHEFSHGIVARAHKIPVIHTGLVFLGPIIGAFVEPNEKNLSKQSDIKQYSVLAAGSFSNILLALVALLLLNFAFMPLQQGMVEPVGFSFSDYYGDNYPAQQANLPPNTIINNFNGQQLTNFMQFNDRFTCFQPGDKITLSTANQTYPLTLAQNPDNPEKPWLGIMNIKNEYQLKAAYDQGIWKRVYYLLNWITGFLRWLFLLSLGIGLFNLLPLPIVDGGKMLQVYLHKSKGKKRGEKWYKRISVFFLVVLLLNLFYPLIRGWLGL